MLNWQSPSQPPFPAVLQVVCRAQSEKLNFCFRQYLGARKIH